MLRIFVLAAAISTVSNLALAQCKDPRFCTTQAQLDEEKAKKALEQRIADDFVKHGGTLNANSQSFDPLPQKDPAKEIADAIDRQTWEQRFADDRRDYETSKQTDALNRIDDSIKLQSLVYGRPFYWTAD